MLLGVLGTCRTESWLKSNRKAHFITFLPQRLSASTQEHIEFLDFAAGFGAVVRVVHTGAAGQLILPGGERSSRQRGEKLQAAGREAPGSGERSSRQRGEKLQAAGREAPGSGERSSRQRAASSGLRWQRCCDELSWTRPTSLYWAGHVWYLSTGYWLLSFILHYKFELSGRNFQSKIFIE